MDAHDLVEAPGNYTEWKKKKKSILKGYIQ